MKLGEFSLSPAYCKIAKVFLYSESLTSLCVFSSIFCCLRTSSNIYMRIYVIYFTHILSGIVRVLFQNSVNSDWSLKGSIPFWFRSLNLDLFVLLLDNLSIFKYINVHKFT